mmetsp:Transcript_68392/g.206792  ORF Transcript_68392/g.206792 Transcript_68392/m.206792 type:complete len:238 (-) Transcript_68392:142-855(-)
MARAAGLRGRGPLCLLLAFLAQAEEAHALEELRLARCPAAREQLVLEVAGAERLARADAGRGTPLPHPAARVQGPGAGDRWRVPRNHDVHFHVRRAGVRQARGRGEERLSAVWHEVEGVHDAAREHRPELCFRQRHAPRKEPVRVHAAACEEACLVELLCQPLHGQGGGAGRFGKVRLQAPHTRARGSGRLREGTEQGRLVHRQPCDGAPLRLRAACQQGCEGPEPQLVRRAWRQDV